MTFQNLWGHKWGTLQSSNWRFPLIYNRLQLIFESLHCSIFSKNLVETAGSRVDAL